MPMSGLGATEKITITLDLHPTLSKYGTGESSTMKFVKGSSIADVLDRLAIPSGIGLTIVVNGTIVSKTTALHRSESLKIFPIIGGG
jgi:sulfur carrier protein ThiS